MEAIYYLKNPKDTTHLDRYPVAQNINDFDKILLMDGALNIDLEFAGHIFKWLDKWEVAVVFYHYNLTLADIADSPDKIKVKEFIYDLRVPLYRDDIFFIRNCENSKLFLSEYKIEIKNYNSPMVAMLKALWKVKPLILYLPGEIFK